ncbi:hypothetical protein JCM24511_08076 [Saitozyma sp. JCM 24511]|nr:hypothetical protein JCM24511_08076 [Saitozyma sp. JCM 24511]
MLILKNTNGSFASAYQGLGIGDYDFKSPDDSAFAFDYDDSGYTRPYFSLPSRHRNHVDLEEAEKGVSAYTTSAAVGAAPAGRVGPL